MGNTDGSTLINGTDYVLALFFGIFFQYFSIAPMTGQYGLITLWRSAKADFLSLTFFEIGLFGWMAIFQVAIFDGKLPMDTVAYWWMMQVYLSLTQKILSRTIFANRSVDWNVLGALDGVSDQLVVDQDRGQGAMRVISKGHHLNIDVRIRSLGVEALSSWTEIGDY